jgi:two-component system, OmpR family, sensor histidine kinase KdpD
MLDEGYRRCQRGADVVIGFAETHGRVGTVAQLRNLEVIPRRTMKHRDSSFEEMDIAAVLERQPDVALVDELAHTNVPGSINTKRWQDVEELLDAGIDVVTTLNIQHLESLNDVVEAITGIQQRETVPDAMVRKADQIELVDMSPEALRKRMSHGNIYPAERIQPALDNYFRAGNLGALRELALLWAADRVEDALDDYRLRNGIAKPWETRERVVVAVTGAKGSDQLIRRAARIASRTHGVLIGVHINTEDGLRNIAPGALERHRDLLIELGGIYKEVAGGDIAQTLVSFARSERATQLVMGASQRSRLAELVRGSVIGRTLSNAQGIDVHVIAAVADEQRLPLARPRMRFGGLPRRRQAAGWVLLMVGLPPLTAFLAHHRGDIGVATDLLLYLLLVVAAGAVGGVWPSLVGAVVGSVLVNYYLVEPTHTLTISNPENFFALVVFLVVAGIVSAFVTLSSRRAHDSIRLRAEAEALARTTATLAGAADPLPMLLEQVRSVFSMDGAAVLRPGTAGGWVAEATAGNAPTEPGEHTTIPLSADEGGLLVLRGSPLGVEDQRLVRAHAEQLGTALVSRQLQREVSRSSAIKEADTMRTALLQAVSHDLRAPLANIKADVTSLLSTEVKFDLETRHEFLTSIDEETDRLNRLVGNLLDMSRLQAGVLTLRLGPVALEDVVSTALQSLSIAQNNVIVELGTNLPFVNADADLLERAVANIVANAIRFTPAGEHVIVDGVRSNDGQVHLQVIDHGPGIDEGLREAVLQPFQRAGDGPNGTGVGLGLAVASGFVGLMGGTLSLSDTAGRGLTVDIALPVVSDKPPEAIQ